MVRFHVKKVVVYLVNHIEILLHDYFSGCIEIAKSLGTFFIPRGFAPWDEKFVPWDLQFQCIPQNDRAITYCVIVFFNTFPHCGFESYFFTLTIFFRENTCNAVWEITEFILIGFVGKNSVKSTFFLDRKSYAEKSLNQFHEIFLKCRSIRNIQFDDFFQQN